MSVLALPACTGMMLGVDDEYGIGSGYYDDYYYPASPSLFAPAPPPPRYYYPGFDSPALVISLSASAPAVASGSVGAFPASVGRWIGQSPDRP